MDEQSIFLNALEQTNPGARAAWLDEACGDDTAQKQRILELLRKHEAAGSFLEKPLIDLGETMVDHSPSNNVTASMDAGLTAAFSVGEAVVLGDANHSVLKMLGNTIADVPHVSLREPRAEGEDPISRPGSPEMPKQDSDSRYRIDGEIARGGMGAVLKGRDTDLGRDLAIKVLLDAHKDNPQVIQRFIEEAQIGGQLQHPGIAPVYELGQFADQRPFFAMKLVKGQTLSKLLRDRQDAADERGKFIGIFEQICQTMAYAHSRGVIHRDLKPANIMVGAFGEVQVMDWGLAKVLPSGGVADEKNAKQTHQGQSIIQTMRSAGSNVPGSFGSTGSDTQMGSVMGTPAYMPPEQALGEIDLLDQRADVFGLGAILCEILTGKPPYVAENGTQVYRMASRGKLDDAFARLDACAADAELVSLAKHCLELEPANRPKDAAALAQRVTGYLESVEIKLRETELQRAAEAAQVVLEQQKRHAATQRNRLWLSLAAMLLILIAVGSVGLISHNRNQATLVVRREYIQNEIEAALETAEEEQTALRSDLGNDREFHKYLSDLNLWRTKLDAVKSTFDRAKNLIDSDQQNIVAEPLRNQLQALEKELQKDESAWQTAVVLDRIRLEAFDISNADRKIHRRLADTEFPKAFIDALGVDVTQDDIPTIAHRIGRLPHRLVLVAALDYWSCYCQNAELRGRLLEIASLVDVDSRRNQVRATKTRKLDELIKLTEAIKPEEHAPPMLLTVAEMVKSKGGDGADFLRSALLAHPKDFWLHFTLGTFLENPDERIGCFKAAVALRPNAGIAHNNWGVALAEKEDFDLAIAHFKQALKINSKHATASFNLGLALSRKQDYEQAIEYFQQATVISPEYVKAYDSWGVALDETGDHDGAIQLFEKVLELDPSYAKGYLNLGLALNEKGDHDGAIEQYKNALGLKPDYAIVVANWALALSAKGDYQGTIEKCEEALALLPPRHPFRQQIQLDIRNAQRLLDKEPSSRSDDN